MESKHPKGLIHCFNSDTNFPGVPAATILELFGGMFFDFCQESGYGSILRVLGSTTRDFLNNLDTLHDHLQVGVRIRWGQ